MSDLQYFRYLQKVPIERLREQVVEHLQNSYAHNAIEIEEYERRLEVVGSSQDRYELLKTVEDLPEMKSAPGADGGYGSGDGAFGGGNDPEHGSGYNDVLINTEGARNEDYLVAVFSGVDRKGEWRPARHSRLVTAFGGMELDYRRALMPPGETYIDAFCIFGGAEIKVPEGLNVEVRGIPIFGGIENEASDAFDPNAPTLKINAFVLFGGLEIKYGKKKKRRR